jgi:RecJ-like exonuclease
VSGNPYKIHDEVDGDTTVEKIETTIRGYDKEKLKWHDEEGYEYLTLNEILEQIQERIKNKALKEGFKLTDNFIPFIRVEYESGLWGVIFEVGNYREMGKQWLVHGVTKGYA